MNWQITGPFQIFRLSKVCELYDRYHFVYLNGEASQLSMMRRASKKTLISRSAAFNLVRVTALEAGRFCGGRSLSRSAPGCHYRLTVLYDLVEHHFVGA